MAEGDIPEYVYSKRNLALKSCERKNLSEKNRKKEKYIFLFVENDFGIIDYHLDNRSVSDNEIVLVDTVVPCVHMKVTDNASNIKKAFKFFDDEATNRKRK